MELAHRKSFGVSELFDLHNTVELIQQHVYAHVNRHGPDYDYNSSDYGVYSGDLIDAFHNEACQST